MKKIIPALFFLFALSSVFAQPVTKYDSKTNKYGIKDEKTKKWLSLPVYNDIQTVSSGDALRYFIAKKGNSKIVISKNGITPLSPFFEGIEELSSNYALVFIKHKNAYSVYELGKGILKNIPAFSSYRRIGYNSDFYKLIRDQSCHLFDARSNLYSPVAYTYIEDIISGSGAPYSFIVKKEKWGVVEFSGKEIIPVVYDTVSNENPDFLVKKDDKWALFDELGNKRLDFKYNAIKLSFSRIFSENFSKEFIPVKQDDKWGAINNSGEIIIPFLYDEIFWWDKNKNIIVKKNGKMGLIDSAGKDVFPFIYTYFERIDQNFYFPTKEKLILMNNGCAACNADISGGKWGIADSTGRIILEPNANIIRIKGPEYNYVNPEMGGAEDSVFIGYLWNIGGEKKEIVAYIDSVETMNEYGEYTGIRIGITRYSYNLIGGKNGIVDRNGKFILPAVFDKFGLCFFGDGYGNPERKFLNEFTDNTRRAESPCAVDTSFLIIAVKEKKFGVYNWKGKEIIPCSYDSINYEYTSYDANDSVFKANNFPKLFFSFYKGKQKGYMDLAGKILVPASIEEELRTISFVSYDSLLLTDNYNPDYYQQKQCRVVLNAGQVKKFVVESSVNPENYYGLAYNDAPIIDTFKLFDRGKFNFLDIAGMKLTDNNWIEDAILLSKTFGAVRITEQGFQFLTDANRYYVNSILDLETGKFISNQRGYEYGADNMFADNIIIKTGGKWYVKNVFKPELKNKETGFDSVDVINLKYFKGYKNGKYAYYSFRETNFNVPEISFEFPDIGLAGSRFVCKNCQYEIKKYSAKKPVFLYDAYGNEYDVNGDEPGDSTAAYTMEIPYVKKGQFNFMTEGNTGYVLKNFADEVLLPSPNYDYSFSLTDTNSAVFNKKFWDKGDDWPLFFGYKNSLAARNGASWTLTTLQNPAKTFDGFQKVKFQNNYWYAFKDGKLYIYRADSLAEIPPRILDFSDINTDEPLNINTATTYFYVFKKNGFGLISEDGSFSTTINNYEAIDLKNSYVSEGFDGYAQQDLTNHFTLKNKDKWGLNCLNQLIAYKLGILNDTSIESQEKKNIENPVLKFEYDSIRLVPFFNGQNFSAYKKGKAEQFTTAGQKIPALQNAKIISVPDNIMINFTDGNPEGFRLYGRVSLICNQASTKILDSVAVNKAAGNTIDQGVKDMVKTEFVTAASSFIIATESLNYFYTDTFSAQNIYFIYDIYHQTPLGTYEHISFAYNPLNESSYLEFLELLKTVQEFTLSSVILQKNNKYAVSGIKYNVPIDLKNLIYDSYAIEKTEDSEGFRIKFNTTGKEPVYYNLKGEKKE